MINAIRSSDHQAVVARTAGGLQRIMDRLVSVSEEYGVRINIKETKVMMISKEGTLKLNSKYVVQVWNR